MAGSANTLRWDGEPGHYEVYYVTATDPHTGVGLWIRYTMVAPLPTTAEAASCSLWFLAMDPRPGAGPPLGRKLSFPIEAMRAHAEPFRLELGGAELTDAGMRGEISDVSWILSWTPATHPYQPVHPLLGRLGAAQTVLVLPHAAVEMTGTIDIAGRRLELERVPGGQAHLWGSKHARRWAWIHCNDFTDQDGAPIAGAFIDGVSAVVSRLGREVGPSTPVVGRLAGRDFLCTSPLRIVRNPSRFDLAGWQFEAVDGRRKVVGEVEAPADQMAGVTYRDPDGELAYCYNSEIASLRLELLERRGLGGGWRHQATLHTRGRAHFEYAQRAPVPGVKLLTP